MQVEYDYQATTTTYANFMLSSYVTELGRSSETAGQGITQSIFEPVKLLEIIVTESGPIPHPAPKRFARAVWRRLIRRAWAQYMQKMIE